MSGAVPVTFAPSGVTVWVEPGTTVLDAARKAGIVIPAPCGGRGRCGKCAVRIIEGTPPPPDELERQGLKLAPKGMRLACLLRVETPITVKPVIVQSSGHRPIGGEDADTRALLAAVDLGTTTVHAVVIDEASGMEIGRGVTLNEQQSFGADVASRIEASIEGASEQLASAAAHSVIAALEAACGSAGSCLRNVGRIVIAANTTMSALLMGDDVSGLAEAPYVAPRLETADLSGSKIMESLAGDARGYLLPGIGAFIGGDALAGIAVAGLGTSKDAEFLIDLGTNAEIVCAKEGELWAASASAGPAFEAVGVASGGPATDGAVSGVSWSDGRLHLAVIGEGDPLWLSGSGLLSLLALLRRLGHLSGDGRLTSEGPLAERFFEVDGVTSLRVSDDGNVVLNQVDVRSLQLAKAAVSAGIILTARRANVRAKRVGAFFVAGGFGASIDPDDLVELGILPQEASGRIRYAGNTSLMGAAMVAVQPDVIDELSEISRDVVGVDLASDSGFSTLFLESTALEPYSLKRLLRG